MERLKEEQGTSQGNILGYPYHNSILLLAVIVITPRTPTTMITPTPISTTQRMILHYLLPQMLLVRCSCYCRYRNYNVLCLLYHYDYLFHDLKIKLKTLIITVTRSKRSSKTLHIQLSYYFDLANSFYFNNK